MNQAFLTQKRYTAKTLVVYAIIAVILLGSGGFLLFYHLDAHSITNADEAQHGVNAYEMEQSGDWIVSTYLGETDYYNLKPPLSMWCIIAGYRLFGHNAFGLRFYSALSMWLTMLIATVWVMKRHGPVVSLFALALLVGQDLLYVGHSMRFGDADALFVLFYTIAMLCMLDSKRNIRWLYGSAFCFGLAFMTKSWHAAMIPLTCFLYLCCSGGIRKLKPLQYALLIVFGLLPIAPWAILRFQRDGLAFFSQTITTDILYRVNDTEGSALEYLITLVKYPGSVIGLILCAIGAVIRFKKQKRPAATEWGLGLWIILPPVLYSFSQFKAYWYIFPILPGLAIAGGIVISKLIQSAGGKALRKGLCLGLATSLILLIGLQFNRVFSIKMPNTFQRTIFEALDRDVDSGLHVYIQYEHELSHWTRADVLCAMLAGDAICLNGGEAAFMEDEEDALLFVDKNYLTYDLLEYYLVILENGVVWVLQN